MKRAGICLWMMIKRMGKHPLYWVLLLLFPAAFFAVPKLNREVEKEQIPVGYIVEKDYSYGLPDLLERELRGTAGGAAEETEGPEEGNVGREEVNEIDRGELFQYIKYTDLNDLKKDIETGEVSCGVVFGTEFAEKLKEQDYYHCITLYLPEGMNVGGIVQEDLFQRVYRTYSAVWYAELLGQQGYQIKPEEVLEKFSEYQKEGKVFAVNYEVQGGNEAGLHNVSEGAAQASALSLRGILAFLTFASSLLGALDGSRDRKRNLGRGIRCPGSLSMAAAGAPILPATLLLAAGMVIADIRMTDVSEMNGGMGDVAGMTGMASGGFVWTAVFPEVVSALLYGLILWLIAMVLGRVLPEKLLEGAMPCFLLIVLLCCPVFLNLGETIPLIGCLSKLFPITWYLEFWGQLSGGVLMI